MFCEALLKIMSPDYSVFAAKGVNPFPDGEIPKLRKDEIDKCAGLK
jgi:hypothetical protein